MTPRRLSLRAGSASNHIKQSTAALKGVEKIPRVGL